MKPRPKHVHTAIAGASLPRHAAGQSPLWGQAKRGCAWGLPRAGGACCAHELALELVVTAGCSPAGRRPGQLSAAGWAGRAGRRLPPPLGVAAEQRRVLLRLLRLRRLSSVGASARAAERHVLPHPAPHPQRILRVEGQISVEVLACGTARW